MSAIPCSGGLIRIIEIRIKHGGKQRWGRPTLLERWGKDRGRLREDDTSSAF